MAINSREDLKDYIMRKLGSPVIMINVAEEQVEDRIDDALDKYHLYHQDGSVRKYIAKEITQQDIDDRRIVLPNGVISVTRALPFGESSVLNMNNLATYSYMQSMGSSLHSSGGSYSSNSTSTLTMTKTTLETIKATIVPLASTQYIKAGREVILEHDLSKIKIGNHLVFECMVKVDPDIYREVYNDQWLKRYATELVKLNWGENVGKYDAFVLPNGNTINYQRIIDEANAEILKLDEELIHHHTIPLGIIMG